MNNLKVFVSYLILIVFTLTAAYAQDQYNGSFYLGASKGWYKIASIDASVGGGCCAHANMELNLNYTNTIFSYDVHATLRFRKNESQNQDIARWRYTTSGQNGEVIRLVKTSSYQYEIWANSSQYSYGYFNTDILVNGVGAIEVVVNNTAIPVGSSTAEDVVEEGNWFMPNGSLNIGDIQNSTNDLLTVAGSARFEEVKVQVQETWPDYVFKEGYELKSIADLEKFIKENGHLPNVPNEKEVAENGIELGEMNRLLLEKIEEMTLHILEMDKAIKEQEKRIKELEDNDSKHE